MNIENIQGAFNRSLHYCFQKQKLAITFVALVLCNIVSMPFYAFTFDSSSWMFVGLVFLPLFLALAILMSLGIVLIRLYYDEVKKRELDIQKVVFHAQEPLLGGLYFFAAVLSIFFALWLTLGVFFLFREVPGLGGFLEVVAAFVPFLLNTCMFLLGAFFVLAIFFGAPMIALKGSVNFDALQALLNRFLGNVFGHLLLLLVGAAPFWAVFSLLAEALRFTFISVTSFDTFALSFLQNLSLAIPFGLLLSPFVVFFFNFAAESYVLLNRKG